jgi:uncharacterized protein
MSSHSLTLTRRTLFIECLFMFVVLPMLVAWFKPLGSVYLILWLLTLYCGFLLHRHYGWGFMADWNAEALDRVVMKRIFLRFLPFCVALTWFTWHMMPTSLFNLPFNNSLMWVSIMLLYPPMSILPQEVICRSFFFRRYEPLLPNPAHIRVASALAFGWMHFIMMNWVAVVFSAIGGVMFADTYGRTRSLKAVCFEHTLYGCYVFTVGLGYYFYHGNAMRG